MLSASLYKTFPSFLYTSGVLVVNYKNAVLRCVQDSVVDYESNVIMAVVIGGIAPHQVIARSEFEVHINLYGVNVTKAVIGAYM